MRVTIDIPDDLARQLEPEREHLVDVLRRGLLHSRFRPASAVDEVFAFLADHPLPQEIIDFQPSQQSVERLRELLTKNSKASLTPHEESELDTIETLNDLFALLKIQARQQAAVVM
jgi:hypothetical protein